MQNTNTFKRLYSELPRGLQEKLPRAPTNLLIKQPKSYCAKTSCNVFNDLSEEDVKKIFLSLDTSKVAGMDQIPA